MDGTFDASSCFPDKAHVSVKHLDCRSMNFGSWCNDGDFAEIDGTNLVLSPPLDVKAGWYPLYLTLRVGYYRKNNVIFVRIPEEDFDICPSGRNLPNADFENLEGLQKSL